MNLVAAFLAVCRARPDGSNLDPHACETVFRHMQGLARSVCHGDEMADDVASRAFLKLLESGEPVFRRSVDEGLARTYMRRMVQRHRDDVYRQRQRDVEIPEEAEYEAPGESPLERLVNEETSGDIEWAKRFLAETIVPRIAERMRENYREGFLRAVGQMNRLAEEEAEFDDIVREECTEVTTVTRNRIYQQHCRARTRFADWLDEELPTLELSSARVATLKALIARMQLRPRG